MAKKILVVDDEEGIRQTLSFVLEDEGYEAVTASSGSEALTNLAEDSFDVVITDLMMPAPDGMEILRKVKADYPGTVVVMITGQGSEEKAVEAMRLGADDYFPKPFNPEKIDEMLVRLEKAIELERLKAENLLFHQHLEMELDIARKIQQILLPRQIPSIASVDMGTSSQSAKQVGGDYHDLIRLPSGDLGIAIGDVSGKGMPAALLMANAQASLRRYSESTYSPGEIIYRINNSICPICQYIEEHRFITLFYGVLNPETKMLTYSNAGHSYPIIFRANSGACEELESTGLPCGIMEDASYDEAQVELGSGDIALLYTDGITEAMNSDGEMFGAERLKDVVLGNLQLDSSGLIASVHNELVKFVGDAPQYDDLTLMVIKVK
ncbi:PP2C family protein-serine/threonine phosphatase [Candidatus Poribacteria bacterium]